MENGRNTVARGLFLGKMRGVPARGGVPCSWYSHASRPLTRQRTPRAGTRPFRPGPPFRPGRPFPPAVEGGKGSGLARESPARGFLGLLVGVPREGPLPGPLASQMSFRKTPRIRTEAPGKGTPIGFRCFYTKPPLKPS